MTAYTLSHPDTEPHRIHADHLSTLHVAFGLLPPALARRMSVTVERALLDGVSHNPERDEWGYGDWTLRRAEP